MAALDGDPDVAVVIGHDGDDTFASLTTQVPTVVWAEERLFTPVGRLGAALRHLEDRARRRTHSEPAAVVVISPAERAWAEQRYPGTPVHVVDHVVDTTYWTPEPHPQPDDPDDEPIAVLAAGRLDTVRNTDGLLAVAGALTQATAASGRDAVAVVAAGVAGDPATQAALVDAGVRYAGAPPDLRPLYRRAAVALVASFATSGAKTTILQAWAMGVPVVTTPAAARSVGALPGTDVVVDDTPEAVARAVLGLLDDPDRRADLARAGRATLERHHTVAAYEQQVSALLEEVGTGRG
nr:glycosyltransferase [Rhabdothermincola salaria]